MLEELGVDCFNILELLVLQLGEKPCSSELILPIWILGSGYKGSRMGRQPCCDKVGLKKGPWTAEEDRKLINFILTNGQCCWRAVPKFAGSENVLTQLNLSRELYFFLCTK